MCAQPFDWPTLVDVARTLLLLEEDFKGEVKKKGLARGPAEGKQREATYCTALDQAEVSPDSKPSANGSPARVISSVLLS